MENISPLSNQPNSESRQQGLVSVLVPVFNHENYIIECLESIEKQSYSSIELIILDDGSSDESFRLAQSWLKVHRERFVRSAISTQPNRGIPATFNTLVRSSHGRYIYLIASDDIALPDALAQLVEFYETNCDPHTLLITDVSLINSHGETIAQSAAAWRKRDTGRLEASTEFLKREVILRWGVPFFHQFYSRTFFNYFDGYDESIDFEDMYFALLAAAENKLRFTRIRSKQYRIRDGYSSTPGLPVGLQRDIAVRKLTSGRFSLIWRCIFKLLNYRDAQRKATSRFFLNHLISAIRFAARITA